MDKVVKAPFNPPKMIEFTSDGTEAELFIQPGKQEPDIFWYRFTKSIEKLGMEFQLSKKQIENLASVKLLKLYHE